MHLDAGLLHRRDGIADGIAVVGVGACIEQDAVIIGQRAVQQVDQLPFVVGLKDVARNAQLLSQLPDALIDLLQRLFAVGARLADAGEIDVRSMQDQYFFHSDFPPAA